MPYKSETIEFRCPSCDVELVAKYMPEVDPVNEPLVDVMSIHVLDWERYDHAPYCPATPSELNAAAIEAIRAAE